jgi:probable HAF family extracellular repeat protein
MRSFLAGPVRSILAFVMFVGAVWCPAVGTAQATDCNDRSIPMPQPGDPFSPNLLPLNRADLGPNWCFESELGGLLAYSNSLDDPAARSVHVIVGVQPSATTADLVVAMMGSDGSGSGKSEVGEYPIGDGVGLRVVTDRAITYAFRVDRVAASLWVTGDSQTAARDALAHRLAVAQEQRIRAVLRVTPLPDVPVPPSIQADDEALARAARREYVVTELRPLPDFPQANPTAINASGQIVGTSTEVLSNHGHAALWDATGVHDLGTLGGPISTATAINAAGVVVGSSWTGGDRADIHAFLWDGQVMRDLGEPGVSSSATGINSSGEVVGMLHNRPVLWKGGHIRAMDPFATGFCYPWAITDVGQVLLDRIGSGRENGGSESYLWEDGRLTNLGSFDAHAINNSGQAVGQGQPDHRLDPQAWLWQDGTLYDLGSLASDGNARATAINDQGDVVGSSMTASHVQHAFVWSGGVISDLNEKISAESGWTLSEATGINTAGQIVGVGSLDGERSAFLLNPVE